MIQEVIVIVILVGVVGWLVQSVVRNYRSNSLGKCSGCCGCSAKDEISTALKQRKAN